MNKNQKFGMFTFLVFIVMGAVFSSYGQNNLYPDSISGLEIEFWAGSNPQPEGAFEVSIVSDKVFDGEKAIKYECADASMPTGGNATAILGGSSNPTGNIAVAAGEYDFTAKVFIEGTAPANILIYLVEQSQGITNGTTLTIPLSEVETGSWQTISEKVTFNDDIAEVKTGFRMRGIDYSGLTGSSVVYIDQIGLFETEPVIDTSEVIYSPILNPELDWPMNEEFSDEFNNPEMNLTIWDNDVNDWGTWSWEPYNAVIKDSVLALKMQQEQHTRGGQDYYFTSGIVQSRETITYGYFETRIKATDKGQGTCPAFWVTSKVQNQTTFDGEIRYSEIDGVEIFQEPYQYRKLEMNLHARIMEDGVLTWKRPGQGDIELCYNGWEAPWDPRDDYHTYAFWNRLDSIFWYVDGIQRGAKKNYYWHLPMHVTVSLGLRTPYEKYIDGVRTVMPYPDSVPEPGFPSEMFCDYVRIWNTPAQLYIDPLKYDTVQFVSGGNMQIECRYFAGNGQTVLADNWNGITCKLQEITADGTVVNEINQVVDETAIGNAAGLSLFTISLDGVPPSESLPEGNKYVLKPVFRTSKNDGEDIYLKGGYIPVQVVVGTLVESFQKLKRDAQFTLYPNPANNHVVIKLNSFPTKSEQVYLYNTLGEVIVQRTIQSEELSVDLSDLGTGLYFIKVGNDVEKLIVQ